MQFLTSTQLARADEEIHFRPSACVGAGTCLKGAEKYTQPVLLRVRASTPRQCTPVSSVSTKAQPGVNWLLQEAWFHSLTTTSGLVHAEEGTYRRVQTKLLFSL